MAGACLCRPAVGLCCFRCCPPIRPPGWDHLDRRMELTPLLRANTDRLKSGRPGGPTDGRSCWGLGFLDQGERLVGCLLHPALNAQPEDGDRRRLTGWQEKCDREVCPEAQVFASAGTEVRRALTDLAGGLDSFAFSSLGANPLWPLLNWGAGVLSLFKDHLRPGNTVLTALAGHPSPRSRAYLLGGLTKRAGPERLGRLAAEPEFWAWFEDRAEAASRRLQPVYSPALAGVPFIHRLGLEPALADFLRIGLGLDRLDQVSAGRLAGSVEAALDGLAAELETGQFTV